MHWSLTLRRKKHLTYFTIGLFNLFSGIELAVILPTVLPYLDGVFHAPRYFLGIVLSSYCFADLVAGQAVGRLSDYTHNTKMILLVSNIVHVAGNLMYFFGLNVWFLVVGQLLAGVGNSATVALTADVLRVTTDEERTSVISLFVAIRQLGLLVGPGCNLFWNRMDFKVGPFSVNSYNALGLFMASLWTLLEVISVCSFWNLPVIHLQEQLERAEADEATQPSCSEIFPACTTADAEEIAAMATACVLVSTPTCVTIETPMPTAARPPGRCIQRTGSHRLVSTRSSVSTANDVIEEAEHFMSEGLTSTDGEQLSERLRHPSWVRDTSSPISQLNNATASSSKRRHVSSGSERRLSVAYEDDGLEEIAMDLTAAEHYSWNYYFEEYVREDVVAVLGIVFLSYFNQLVFEMTFTPLVKKFLGWGAHENGLVFCTAGFEAIFILLGIRLCSRVADVTLVVFGLVVQTALIAFFTWFVPNGRPGDVIFNTPVVLVAMSIGLCGFTLVGVASVSLYLKITNKETQGFAQGLCRVFVSLGLTLGPLWAAGMVDQPYIMFGAMLLAIVVLTIPLAMSYNELSRAGQLLEVLRPRNLSEHNETAPLLL